MKALQLEKNDASAILYEPSENVILQKFSSAYYPFTYRADALARDSSLRENTIPNWIYQTNQVEELPGTSVKIKRKHSFPIQVNGDNENYEPLVLDIDVRSKSNYEMIGLKYLLQNKMDKWTEKKLKDCLDLYFILLYKNQSTEIPEDNSINTKNNKMYSHLSDADITAEINYKCKVVADAITESVNDAKKKRVHFKNHDIVSPNTSYKSEIAEVDKSQETNIFWQAQDDYNNLNRIVKTTDNVYLETSTLIDNEVLVPDHFRSNVFSTDNYVGNESVLSIPFTTEADIFDTTAETNQQTNSINKKNETLFLKDTFSISPGDFPISDSENESSTHEGTLTTVYADSTHIYLTKSTSEISNQAQDEINTAVTEQFHVSDEGSNYWNYNEYIRKTAYRKEYFEGEYEIPKLVTVEFSNNTIISEIQGNEKIPNEDFVTPKDVVVEEKSNCTFTTTNHLNKSRVADKDNVLVGEVKNISEAISGKLYFKYGTEFVPASFLQQREGNLDIAIDLPSLCKSNKQVIMSQIIQTICNCIKVRP